MLKKLLAKIVFKIIHSEAYDRLKQDENSRHYVIDNLKSLGKNYAIPPQIFIKNPQYISVGDHFSAMYNLRLEAWDEFIDQKFTPSLEIGNNVSFNTDCHVGCINKIIIGNNVMIASRVYISDHSHGNASLDSIKIIANHRPLITKGPVIIEDNVWIGEGACILPGVTIGKNSIIGANAVVTKNVPANSIVAGVPAKILKKFEEK